MERVNFELGERLPWIIRDTEQLGDADYLVFPAHPAFAYLWNVVLSVSAMSIALGTFHNQAVNPGDHIRLSCIGFDYTIRIPAHGAMHDAVYNRSTAYVPLTVHNGRELHAQAIWAPALRSWIDGVLWPGLVDLYEKHTTRIHKKNPEVGRLAKVLRDSFAHAGKVTMHKGSPPASWGDIRITNSDIGRPVSEFFGLGDFLILAMKMFDRSG